MLNPSILRVVASALLSGLLVIFFAVFGALAFAFGPYEDVKVLKVKDGDTIEVMVEVWPSTYIGIDVRVRGIDTPETRRGVKSGVRIPECEISKGMEAKSYATEIFINSKVITLINVDPKATKYAGRISGDFLLDAGKFSDRMITAGHAIPYEGGKREVWSCQ